MASKNETVAEIVNELRDDANTVADDSHDGDCWTNLEAMEIYYSLADRFEAAHKREVDSLNFKLMTTKSEQKTAGNVIIEQTNKVEKLEREISELRECLTEAFACVRIDLNMGIADARIIKTAPKLYDCLHDAVIEMCHGCADAHETYHEECPLKDGDCFVQRWRKALAEAAGESEVK